MAPRLTKVNLKGLEVSESDLQKARQLIAAASQKEQRSKMASMVHYLKNTGCNPEILQSRGAARQDYLAKFLAHQLEEKDQESKSTNKREVANRTPKVQFISVF